VFLVETNSISDAFLTFSLTVWSGKAKLPTAARRNIVSSKAPSAVPVERGASYT